MFCNRGIYHEGWSAVTRHRTPWDLGHVDKSLDSDEWELYDGNNDWTQAHDLAKENPVKLAELQRLFLIQATRFNVLPLDDRAAERLIPAVAGRPTLIKGDTQTLYPGMGGLNENGLLDVKNKSFSVTAEVEIPESGADGVIVNQGGITGGWSLYFKESTPVFVYSFLGIKFYEARATSAIASGKHGAAHALRLRRRRAGPGRHGHDPGRWRAGCRGPRGAHSRWHVHLR